MEPCSPLQGSKKCMNNLSLYYDERRMCPLRCTFPNATAQICGIRLLADILNINHPSCSDRAAFVVRRRCRRRRNRHRRSRDGMVVIVPLAQGPCRGQSENTGVRYGALAEPAPPRAYRANPSCVSWRRQSLGRIDGQRKASSGSSGSRHRFCLSGPDD